MLTFDPIPHAYRWNGVIVPSVTQVLEDVGVIDYSYIPSGTREMALERGRMVHEAIHYDDEGDLDEPSTDEMLMAYVHAWRRWRTDSGFIPSLIEHRGYNEQCGFAGTLDRSGTMYIAGEIKVDVIVDAKTNDAPRWAELQTAAYASFFDSPRRFLRVIVELHKDGTYRTFTREGKDWQNDFNRFMTCMSVYWMKREYNSATYKQRMRQAKQESV